MHAVRATTRDSSRAHVTWAERVVMVAAGVLGWLTAQHLTFGLIAHTHLGADGHLSSHEHRYAGPLAVVSLALLVLALVAVSIRASVMDSAEDHGSLRARHSGLRAHAALAVLAFVAVEFIEELVAGDANRAAQLGVVIAVGSGVQLGASALVQRLVPRLLEFADSLAVVPLRPLGMPQAAGVALGECTPQQYAGAQTFPSTWRGRAPPTVPARNTSQRFSFWSRD